MEGVKTCNTCAVTKPLTEFHKCKQNWQGRHNQCRQCRSATRPRRIGTERERHLQRTYGMSLSDYEDMLAEQDGVCAVCGKEPGAKPLSVDHCHSTGIIRGLLCQQCNVALGMLKDDPVTALRLSRYLLRGVASP